MRMGQQDYSYTVPSGGSVQSVGCNRIADTTTHILHIAVNFRISKCIASRSGKQLAVKGRRKWDRVLAKSLSHL